MSFIRVYSKELTPIADLDNITSMSTTICFFKPGIWEVHMPYFEGIHGILEKAVYFLVNNDSSKTFILENIIIDDNKNSEIKLSGSSLSGVLRRRLVLPNNGDNYYRLDNLSIENIMREYVRSQCIDPFDLRRKFPFLILDKSENRGKITNWRGTYNMYLDEILTDIGIYGDLGYDIYLDIAGKRSVFRVLEGRDLSASQNKNPNVIFSSDLDNLGKISYERNTREYKNSVYALMGNIEKNNFTVHVTRDADLSGLSLREVFVDVTSKAENVSELVMAGEKAKKEYIITESVSGEILDTDSFKYEQDWNLGDIVTVVHKKAGKILTERITEITHIYEMGGEKIEIVFGTDISDPVKKIESMERKIR